MTGRGVNIFKMGLFLKAVTRSVSRTAVRRFLVTSSAIRGPLRYKNVSVEDFPTCQDYIQKVLGDCKNEGVKDLDWPHIADNVVRTLPTSQEIRTPVMPSNLEHFVIGACARASYPKAALDFVRHVESQDQQLKAPTIGMLLRLFGRTVEGLSDQDKAKVSEICEKVLNSVEQRNLKKHALGALANARQLKDVDSVVDQIEASDQQKALDEDGVITAVKNIALNALATKDYKAFWKAVRSPSFKLNGLDFHLKSNSHETECQDEVISKFIETSSSPTMLEELFQFFRETNYMLTPVIQEALLQKTKSKVSQITKRSKCPACQSILRKENDVTMAECSKLFDLFLNEVLHRHHDIYSSTTPEELDSFIKFLKGKKYEVVLDGLNVALSGQKVRKVLPIQNQIENVSTKLCLKCTRIIIRLFNFS